MDLGLRDKVVVITGGAGGLGAAMAHLFSAEGARVVVVDRDAEAARATAVAAGPEALGMACDVAFPNQITALFAAVRERQGRLDILINCAGILHTQPIHELTAEHWRQLLDINLIGTFLCAQAAIPLMERGGCIVNIGSVAGQTGGFQAGADYAASKSGVICLTKSLAAYAGPLGIRVNCLNPGTIDTAMTAGWGDDAYERLRGRTPLGRLGVPEDIAGAALFLCSPLASFVHGAHLDVNGGLHMD